jgi:hypothetical protein
VQQEAKEANLHKMKASEAKTRLVEMTAELGEIDDKLPDQRDKVEV